MKFNIILYWLIFPANGIRICSVMCFMPKRTIDPEHGIKNYADIITVVNTPVSYRQMPFYGILDQVSTEFISVSVSSIHLEFERIMS